LGRRFFGRSLRSDQEYVLDQLFNLVRDLNPDVMVVAGDVFHQRQPSEEALGLFHETLNKLLNLGTTLVFLAGPSDDFKSLHLDGRWVRDAGIHLIEDVTQVLSPITFLGARDDFGVKTWCMPYPKSADLAQAEQHPALVGHGLVEKVVQRLNPSEINIFLGYAWAQDSGRQVEFGNLVQPGGLPIEKRMLEFFDVAALGGRHKPYTYQGLNAGYSGSLLCYEPDEEEQGRSVTFYDIAGKSQIYVDQYPLRPRRSFRILEGSWEELMQEGAELRSDDLIVLRSEEKNLSAEQRADLRILSPNVVSVELPSPFHEERAEGQADELSPLLQSFQTFCRESGDYELTQECLNLLRELEGEI
jgi:DNA repair protein SbcD/Mre11